MKGPARRVVTSTLVAKLIVLAEGVVKGPSGPRAISAYVALSAGPQSRVFRVRGAADAPFVEELPAATTLDVRRFQVELQDDLRPALDALREEGHPASVEACGPDTSASAVREHLKATEGLDVP